MPSMILERQRIDPFISEPFPDAAGLNIVQGYKVISKILGNKDLPTKLGYSPNQENFALAEDGVRSWRWFNYPDRRALAFVGRTKTGLVQATLEQFGGIFKFKVSRDLHPEVERLEHGAERQNAALALRLGNQYEVFGTGSRKSADQLVEICLARSDRFTNNKIENIDINEWVKATHPEPRWKALSEKRESRALKLYQKITQPPTYEAAWADPNSREVFAVVLNHPLFGTTYEIWKRLGTEVVGGIKLAVVGREANVWLEEVGGIFAASQKAGSRKDPE
jgi:hypothetical protein